MIKLKVIGPNQTQVHINDVTLFFSYDTLVAIRDNGIEFRTDQKYSKTTSKHINQWCNANAQVISQENLNTYLQIENRRN